MFASKHSTSSLSTLFPSALLPSLTAATNSSNGILVLRIFSPPSFPPSYPPAMNTFRSRFRKAISRPLSRVRYMRRRTNSSSPTARAASKPERFPERMQMQSGVKRLRRRGYGLRRLREGSVCVVSRWQGMR